MHILGVTYRTHNAGVSLIHDGEMIASAEEERFNREKYSWKFPVRSFKYALAEAGIEPGEIDAVGYGDPAIADRRQPGGAGVERGAAQMRYLGRGDPPAHRAAGHGAPAHHPVRRAQCRGCNTAD